jgi:phage FluMu protein Com
VDEAMDGQTAERAAERAADPLDREVDPLADQVLDGNAVGGVIASILGIDVTAVPGRCAHCGSVSVVASMRAYVRAPGTVLRCPVCEQVVVRIVETDEATYLDARGAAYLRFEHGASGGPADRS